MRLWKKQLRMKKLHHITKKEAENSLNISKKYRTKINPKNYPLQGKDITYIRDRLINKVKSKLKERISEGYKNINLNLIEDLVSEQLKKLNINN